MTYLWKVQFQVMFISNNTFLRYKINKINQPDIIKVQGLQHHWFSLSELSRSSLLPSKLSGFSVFSSELQKQWGANLFSELL